MRRPLNERQLKWVERYLAHGDGPRAAVEAGYSKNSCMSASRDLKADPRIKKILDKARARAEEKAVGKASYNYEVAMAEALECLEFAKSTKNAAAMVKAAELRSKLSGLLIDKIDLSQNVNFRIVIGGISDQPKLVTEAAAQTIAGAVENKEGEDDA